MKHKISFASSSRIEPFFTGGSVSVTKCGMKLFTQFSNAVKCLDFKSGQLIFTIKSNEEDEVTSFLLMPSDDGLIIAHRNTILAHIRLLLDHDTFSVERTWKSGHKGPVSCMDISDDGRLLATGSGDSTVKVWDLQAQYCTHTLKDLSGCVTLVRFAPSYFFAGLETETATSSSPKVLVFGDDVGKFVARDLTNDHFKPFTSSKHTSTITAAIFHQNSIYVASRDSILSHWTMTGNGRNKAEPVLTLKRMMPVFESLEALSFCHIEASDKDDRLVLTGGETGTLKVWSTKSGRSIRSIDIHCKGPILNILECDTLRCYLVVTFDQNIVRIAYEDFQIQGRLVGHNDEIYDVTFCGVNQNSALVATNSCDLRLYDLETFRCDLLLGGHKQAILGVDVASWCPDVVASCSKDSSISIWNLMHTNKTRPCFVATGHAAQINAIRFSRIKSQSEAKSCGFLASVSDDRTLKIWSLPELDKLTGQMLEDPGTLSSMSTVVAHEKEINALDISPNDKFIATGSMDKCVKIWRIEDPQKLSLSLVATKKDHKRGVFDVKFSPVDQVIVTSSGDFTLKIFALSDFSCIKTFEGHQAAVLRVVFSSNGTQLVSTDSAGVLKMWTIKTNECVQTIDGHDDKIYALCSDIKCDRLLTGGADSHIILWKDATGTVLNEKSRAKKDKLESEQRLANLQLNGDYARALLLALKLSRPHDTYKIIEKFIDLPDAIAIIASLRDDQMNTLLNFATEWNSNSRYYLIAQKLLTCILRSRTIDDLLKMVDIEKIVQGFLPYSERHFERLTRARQQSYFVDYVWSCANLDTCLSDNRGSYSTDSSRRIKLERPDC